jgi:hypothetical protein
VCTENLIRIDCVTEFPNVNGDDRAPSPLSDPVPVIDPQSGLIPQSIGSVSRSGRWTNDGDPVLSLCAPALEKEQQRHSNETDGCGNM